MRADGDPASLNAGASTTFPKLRSKWLLGRVQVGILAHLALNSRSFTLVMEQHHAVAEMFAFHRGAELCGTAARKHGTAPIAILPSCINWS